MDKPIAGLHHVTSICGSPQDNVAFYTGVLRQRLVKKTVNFDDPGTYYLYYADRVGSPGSVLTFCPFAEAKAHLGEALKLPPRFESRRASIERALTLLSVPEQGRTA